MSDKNISWAIFDLDGCLFDDSYRKHHLKNTNMNSQARWDAYHSQIENDTVIPQALERLADAVARELGIIVITGRPEKYSAITRKMVDDLFVTIQTRLNKRPLSWSLAMRPTGDKRSSPEFKKSVLDDYGMHEGNVEVAYDDRPDVLDMYSHFGLHACRLDRDHDGFDEWNAHKPNDALAGMRKAMGDEPKPASPVINANVASLEPVADLMDQHAATFRERYESYGNNAEVVGRVMTAMFPNGVVLKTAKDFEIWHLFELMIVKLSRFSSSGLRHEDSINDLPAYCGMVHRLINDHDITFL